MSNNTDYEALSKQIQSKGYKRNANQKEMNIAKQSIAKKMSKKSFYANEHKKNAEAREFDKLKHI